MGSHLVTPRLGFTHHGIYVGNGHVVHHGSLTHRLPGGPVAETSLAHFAHGHRIWVRSDATPRFASDEVIRRARSRVGEQCYRLLSNNCEHFCEWCMHGQPRSYQVERAFLLPLLIRLRRAAVTLLLNVPSRLARS
jgi:hypothetical protein